MMKKLLKEYEAPLCDVVEVRAEGVLCGSGTEELSTQDNEWVKNNGWN